MIDGAARAMDAGPRAFQHIGLFYRSRDEYLAGTITYIRRGLAAGEPVMVAVPSENLKLIREEIGSQPVLTHDMSAEGRNPGRILPGVLLAFAQAHPGRRVRIVGEPMWPARTPLEYPACAQHEALINAAFHGRDASILCPYDAAHLGDAVLHDARRTHPLVETSGTLAVSADYGDPVDVVAGFNVPLTAPPAHAAAMTVTPVNLAEIRRLAGAQGVEAGLPRDRIADLVLAVNELATNTVLHAGSTGTVRIWIEAAHLVCDVTDSGHLANPLAGRLPAPVDQAGGRGLLLVNHLCDLVRVHTRPAATTIRIYIGRENATTSV
jgi:anti-sigma regulatory factor (Ser/Thr protein kinase)